MAKTKNKARRQGLGSAVFLGLYRTVVLGGGTLADVATKLSEVATKVNEKETKFDAKDVSIKVAGLRADLKKRIGETLKDNAGKVVKRKNEKGEEVDFVISEDTIPEIVPYPTRNSGGSRRGHMVNDIADLLNAVDAPAAETETPAAEVVAESTETAAE